MVDTVKIQELPQVSVVIPLGTTDRISFPNRFFGVAKSLRITNLDAINVATYQIGGEATPLLTLAASASRAINDTDVNLLIINAGAAGSVQVEAQIQLIK